MEKEDVKIDKVVLNVGGEKISLSVDQAKKLKSLLDELFGKEVIKEITEKHHYHDWYYRPYIQYVGSSAVPHKQFEVLCSNNTLNLTV